ncbi:MAG: hypothetical protein A3E87_04220 [Gammaproteobacteria bacterium RIFCSPHIGHO2_12_FULL_35_23]|nr:MAG: hypothetical protein A3E87_04220 [Gammaproteobacteria bacterium RIFCSPHIGHO2_12_FULL_35_23]
MKVIVEPKYSRVDQNLTILLTELLPSQNVTLSVSTQDAKGLFWSATATFKADKTGTINVASQAPIKGSYQGKHALGLFWSMKPNEGKGSFSQPFALQGLKKLSIQMSAKSNNQVLFEETLERYLYSDKIERREIKEPQLSGTLFLPKTETPLPAIAIIPGSRGVSVVEPMAALLAEQGYIVKVIAYPNQHEGEIYELPIEGFKRSILWLSEHPQVLANKIMAIGISKGAEALLTTLAYFPELKLEKVIAISPSSVVWQGLGKGRPKFCSSWSLFNEPVAYLPMHQKTAFRSVLISKLLSKLAIDKIFPSFSAVKFVKTYRKAFKNKRAAEEAAIPIEKIRAPLLLISGAEDKLWPASMMCEQIKTRLKAKQFNYPIEHINYFQAGHVFMFPGIPSMMQIIKLPVLTLALGGNRKGAAMAWQAYWQKLLNYLQV